MKAEMPSCPRTGRPLHHSTTGHRGAWPFPLLGLAALAWFLIRVLPKPSRAAYPCQRAAAPLAAGSLGWLAGLAAPLLLSRKARAFSNVGRHVMAGGLAALAILGTAILSFVHFEPTLRAVSSMGTPYQLMDPPLSPVGVGRGISRGRVVWAHDPKAVSWDLKDDWWEDAHNDQHAIDGLLSHAVRWLSNEKDDAAAWQALFKYFNATHGRGQTSYRPGEKIAIKVNLNNTTDHATNNRLNTSPHLTLSLVRELVEFAHVKPSEITIFDPSRFVPAYLFDKIRGLYPEVAFVDHIGGDGRIKAEFEPDAIPFSVPGNNATGIATTAIEATYLIDVALLKGHVGTGVTLCAKNLFGVTSINPDWRKNAHDHFNQDRAGAPVYSTFTDFLAHKDLGEKTMLFLIDALYANDLVDDPPHLKWQMAPFNNNWPGSLFASQDGVAIDSVGLDFLRSEWPELVDLSYCDNYMREAALANDPPSKTFYDPGRGGTRSRSLGVHEHWNNAADKKYSRNLGMQQGIELYTGPN